MLDYKLLTALVAVIEAGGFEKAAERLNVTQSAISQRIKLLESRLGGLVLVRSTPPRPTALGKQLDNHYHRIVQLENELGFGNESESIAKAKIVTSADALGGWFYKSICDLGDELLVDLVIEDQNISLEMMKRGEVLACLCSDDHVVNGSRVDALGYMRYRAYASSEFVKRHDLKKNLSNLVTAPCLIYNNKDKLQHEYLEKLGLSEPTNLITCPSIDGFIKLASNGYGYGLLCELQVEAQVKAGLIQPVGDEYIDIPMYWHSWRTSSEVMLKLRNAVIHQAKQNLIQG